MSAAKAQTDVSFPTRRLVDRHDADGVADRSFAAITIDIDAVAVERS